MGLTEHAALIRGERVYLRHPTAADQKEYLSLRRASADFHRPWEPLPTVDPFSAEEYAAYLEGHGEAARRERLLVCRSEDDAILEANIRPENTASICLVRRGRPVSRPPVTHSTPSTSPPETPPETMNCITAEESASTGFRR